MKALFGELAALEVDEMMPTAPKDVSYGSPYHDSV